MTSDPKEPVRRAMTSTLRDDASPGLAARKDDYETEKRTRIGSAPTRRPRTPAAGVPIVSSPRRERRPSQLELATPLVVGMPDAPAVPRTRSADRPAAVTFRDWQLEVSERLDSLGAAVHRRELEDRTHAATLESLQSQLTGIATAIATKDQRSHAMQMWALGKVAAVIAAALTAYGLLKGLESDVSHLQQDVRRIERANHQPPRTP